MSIQYTADNHRTSYCEICDTNKRGVRWYSEPFTIERRPGVQSRLYSSCEPCTTKLPDTHKHATDMYGYCTFDGATSVHTYAMA